MFHPSTQQPETAAVEAGSAWPLGVSVVIPCLNEAGTIARAVRAAWDGLSVCAAGSGAGAVAGTGALGRLLPGEVIVADNGSTDGSQQLAVAAGARVVAASIPGYGAALDAGIRAARYEYVVFADADLSYPLDQVSDLVAPLSAGRADFVLGSRLRGEIAWRAMPWLNRFVSTPLLSGLIRLIYGLPTSDCNSGMRALRRSQYDGLGLGCSGMEYASEMLMRVAQANLRYLEIPIEFSKDQRPGPPHLRRWRDGWRHLRFILGNASNGALISAPAGIGLFLLVFSFLVSFGWILNDEGLIHFHSAFVAIALAMPFLLFSSMNVVVRFSLVPEEDNASGVLGWIRRISDRAVPFYLAVFLYALGGVEVLLMFKEWMHRDFQRLFEIGSVIRLMIYTSLATVLFTTDMAMGLVRWRRIDREEGRGLT